MKRTSLAIFALLVVAAFGAGLMLRAPLQRWLMDRQPLPAGGQIVLPLDAGLAVYDLSARSQSILLPAQRGTQVTSAAWSPDHQQVAFGLFHRRTGDPASVSEIYLIPAAGGSPRPLAERDRPGAVLDTPTWSPDGQSVYFSYYGQVDGRMITRVERVTVETGERAVVVENGHSPAISPDGRTLAYLRDASNGSSLWMQPLDGGEARAVLPPGKFPALAVPRFSPDGRRLLVSIMNSRDASLPAPSPADWLLPPPAYAHGDPWDVWTFDLNGEDPRRLTEVNADDPSAAWSPDGRHVAFWGGTGLYLVPAQGGQAVQVLNRGGYGAIDWAP